MDSSDLIYGNVRTQSRKNSSKIFYLLQKRFRVGGKVPRQKFQSIVLQFSVSHFEFFKSRGSSAGGALAEWSKALLFEIEKNERMPKDPNFTLCLTWAYPLKIEMS